MDKPDLRLITLPEVIKIVPYSPSHLWRLERAGKFPKRVQIGANRIGWVAEEIDRWIDKKIQNRTSQNPTDLE